jgi:peroxiredoxin Q/BCP
MENLNIGQKAPAFEVKDMNGNLVTLESYRGKKVILYFYPKDDTPGCTAEACSLRDNYSELTSKGFVVIGVSADNEKSHSKFASKYNLPFILIPDTDKVIIRAYNAWGVKEKFGKRSEGIIRKTYVISEQGIIEKIIDKVDTKNHASQILKELGL